MNGADAHLHCLQQALALISSARPEEALLALSVIPGDSGLHPHALHLRGIAHATQGRTADAQAAYDAARKAYPLAQDRAELDTMAMQNGLVAK